MSAKTIPKRKTRSWVLPGFSKISWTYTSTTAPFRQAGIRHIAEPIVKILDRSDRAGWRQVESEIGIGSEGKSVTL